MIHRTFRSLDEPPKLLGFTLRQWATLIALAAVVLGAVEVAHLPDKAALSIGVFLIGVPAALTYVSESGGLSITGLLCDLCRWRIGAKRLAPASQRTSGPCARGVLVLADASSQQPEHAQSQREGGAASHGLAEPRA